jgi:hypothetical protein
LLSPESPPVAVPKLEEADEFRRGVPREETVTAQVPSKGQGQALTVEGQSQALQGLPAEYWGLTFGVSTIINGGAAFVGILVKTVVSFPPTTIAPDRAVWGPFSGALDPITWRVTVDRVGDHKFHYQFDGQSKLSPGGWVTVLAGTHTAALDDQGDPIEGFGAAASRSTGTRARCCRWPTPTRSARPTTATRACPVRPPPSAPSSAR